jgi:hypothetical protein
VRGKLNLVELGISGLSCGLNHVVAGEDVA